MAAVSAPSADQAADLMKNLAFDSQTKTHDSAEVPKKPLSVQYGSANGEAQNTQVPPRESSLTPLLQEVNQVTDMGTGYMPSAYPSGYVYGGYGVSGDWEDYSRYMNQEGVEMSSGIYSGYGYPPYGSYPTPVSPLPTMGHDGQLYGPQHYQYPTSYYQAPAPPPASYAPGQSPISRGDVSTSAAADLPLVSADLDKSTQNGSAKANANGSNMSVPLKPIHNNLSVATKGAHGRGTMPGGVPASSYQDPRYGYDGMRSSMPWYDTSLFSAGQHRPATTSSVSYTASRTGNNPVRSQSQYQLPHYMGLNSLTPTQGMGSAAPGYLNKMYPNSRFYGQFGNNYRTAYGYGPNGYDSRINGRWSMATDSKYNTNYTRGRGNRFYGYGGENPESFSELNIGPRAGRFRNPKAFGTNAVISPKEEKSSTVATEEANGTCPDKEQYNREDFPDHHLDAKFFIIKSYSEDDVHRSIKYNVWASTPNGNGKLDAAFKEAQEKVGRCPVFLFFSVNTSGQFIGAAEMVGPVDFQKTQDYWQQDKWFGCFPVKWHIVKDVPNSILKHITLENNDNKPVTNSRDTQEVKLEQGNQMLKLFKEHVSKTSILDDFDFYETRQKLMQERKAKQKQFQKQDLDGKTIDALVNNKVEDVTDATARPEKPLESASVLNKESTNGEPEELKVSDEDGGMGTGDAPKDAEPVVTENIAEGGAANGC